MNGNSDNRVRGTLAFLLSCIFLPAISCAASPAATTQQSGPQLTFVVVLSRHGVRPPIGNVYEYNKYSSASWPKWSVPPGYLTPHGYELLKIFGSYYRSELTAKNLLAAAGCNDASQFTIIADFSRQKRKSSEAEKLRRKASNERTHESAKAIAQGMFPNCSISVASMNLGSVDFPPGIDKSEKGRKNTGASYGTGLAANRLNWVKAHTPEIAMLDGILKGCGKVAVTNPKRISLFDLPMVKAGSKDSTRMDVASGITEGLLLEYTDGMKDPGWGCLTGDKLRYLMGLYVANHNIPQRVLKERIGASSFLTEVMASMQQSVSQKKVPGALGRPGDKVLFLMGHDGNIRAVAHALGMHWVIGGRRDGTPPGGALMFELWKNPNDSRFVRVFYTAQTIDQMRNAEKLSTANPPISIPLFIPNCSTWDDSCTWDSFQKSMGKAMPHQAAN